MDFVVGSWEGAVDLINVDLLGSLKTGLRSMTFFQVENRCMSCGSLCKRVTTQRITSQLLASSVFECSSLPGCQ